MLFGNRRPRTSDARRRSHDAPRPRAEQLESRALMTTTVPLATNGVNLPPQIATAPYGFDFAGGITTNNSAGTGAGTTLSKAGAGWSVSDLGDVNGDGYDDFAVGAPSVSNTTTLANSGNSVVYLIFGSRTVTSTAIQDWIALASGGGFLYNSSNRVGDLSQLGSSSQTNPITGSALTLPFAGVTFSLSAKTPNASLGASVSSVKIGSTYSLLIGAPTAQGADTGSTPGTGRAYLITGNPYSLVGQTVQLDNLTSTQSSAIKVTTFVNSVSVGGQLGFSVAGGTNILGDGGADVILGAPNATVSGTTGTGAVYVMPAGAVTTGGTVDVSKVGTSVSGVILAGAASGSQAGWSVADAFSVNATGIDSLIIGAPSQGGGGAAYLVYGGNISAFAQTVTANGITYRYVPLAAVGNSGGAPGAVFLGPAGSSTGYSVNTAGFFDTASNVTPAYSDIIIGSPFFSSGGLTGNGMATVIYGGSSRAANFLTGTYTLNPGGTTGNAAAAYLVGAGSGDFTGYSVAPVGYINTGQPGLVLIGSPGFNSDSGAAYLIAGLSGGFTGAQVITSAAGLQFTATTPNEPSGSTPFLGASVSSRYRTTSVTADGDTLADMIIGAPGYDVSQSGARPLAGGAFVVEGGLVSVPLPNTFPVTVNGTAVPFRISATTPANLSIYVYATPGGTFQPVRDLNPTSLIINGVTFTAPALTETPDPNRNDWLNGFQDVIITITPRSALGLVNGSNVPITVVDAPPSTSPLFGQTWSGTAFGAVAGGIGPTPTPTPTPVPVAVGAVGGAVLGPNLVTSFVAPFGSTTAVPTIGQLSAYNYAPIPLSVAMQQYLPSPGFNDRLYAYNHNGRHLRNYTSIRGQSLGATGLFMYKYNRYPIFVDNRILDRSRFHPGKSYRWTHHAPNIGSIYGGVVPVQQRTQSILDVNGVKAQGNRQIGHPPDHSSSYNTYSRGGGL